MDSAHGRKVILANWKMHKTIEQTAQFIDELAPIAAKSYFDIWIAPAFTALGDAAKHARHMRIGAQNLSQYDEGAFTGEISASMLKEAGAEFVLLGHSERRCLFAETFDIVHQKLKRALNGHLQPVLCVGESQLEHRAGKTRHVLEQQITTACNGLAKELLGNLVLAYEPVWAIGSGSAATFQQIEDAHAFCRQVLSALHLHRVPIFYGGSVQADNAAALLMVPEVSGLLVGKAALQVNFFESLNRL